MSESRTPASRPVVALSLITATLGAVAAGAGLWWPEAGQPFSFATVREQSVIIFGRGLYRDDSRFLAAGFEGQDRVTLLLGVPLLVVLTFLYRRGSFRSGLLLLGVLAYFLYVYASMALGAAFNSMYLVYVALLSSSFFALVCLFRSIDSDRLLPRTSPRLPRRAPAVFLSACGLLTAIVWLSPVVGALARGQPPALLDHYTTLVTYVLDLAIITPSTWLAAVLILRRAPLGYLMAVPLIVLVILLGPVIVASTVCQRAAGVAFSPAEMIGPVAGFVTLGVLGIWVLGMVLRNIGEDAPRGAVVLPLQ